MRWFENLSTRAKLFIGFGLMVVLLAVVIVTAYVGLASIQKSQETLYREHFRFVWEMLQVRTLQNEQRAEVFEMMLVTEPAAHEASEQELATRAKEIDQRLQRLFELGQNDPNFLRGLEEFKATLAELRKTRATQTKLIREGKNDEAKKLSLGIQQERHEKFKSLARQLGDHLEEQVRAAVEQSERRANQSVLIFLAVGLLALLLGCAMVWALNRSIASRLAVFMQFVERVGRGDLTRQAALNGQANPRGRNEVARLGHALDEMVAGLRELAGQTRQVTQNLNSAAAEIMASIQQQAAGTKEQAAAAQQITTTMNEVAQSGAQISDRAKQVAAAAEATSATSTAGIQTVQDTTRTMGAIRQQVEEVAEHIVTLSEKTQAVGEIVATVNDIAERSNLLALNAAIEAAAAGEQGNRFGVVASEMKSLADQAKESTVQVRTILGEIQKGINSSVMLTEEAVKRVESGKQQVDVAEETIRGMAETTIESVQAFQQIVGAGNQQQIGFEQVAQGMKDIGQAAGQTAAATSQLEKAVASLTALSQQLEQAVGRYQI